MATSSCTLLVLLLAVRGSIQASSPASLTYRAGVAEFKAMKYTNDLVATWNGNADKIVNFIDVAARRGVDILVFPELALNSLTLGTRLNLISRSTLVPDPSENYAPCTNSSIPVIEAVKTIACAVERGGIYVVVNLLERELCSQSVKNCRSDGVFLYVTNVVFDRTGKIISKARKSHLLYYPDVLDVTETSEPQIFETDFGVTFGSVVCFDIMFEDMLLALTRKHNITDIVHCSAWYSTMPFLTTIQIEAAFAYAEDINFLSSGHNFIEVGESGSGIYAGRQGVVAAVFPLDHHEELLIADLPKKSKKIGVTPSLDKNHERDLRFTSTDHGHRVHEKLQLNNDTNGYYWRYEKFNHFEGKIITENGFTVQRLNHTGIDCEFKVNVTNLSPPGVTYGLFAFDGIHDTSDSVKLGIKICAIVLCANDTIGSCGHTLNTPAIFSLINITASYVDNSRTLMMPNTLGSDLLPLDNWSENSFKQGERIDASIFLTTPIQNVVTFGFWGRNFEKDIPDGIQN